MEHLYRKLKEYANTGYYPFHMPGPVSYTHLDVYKRQVPKGTEYVSADTNGVYEETSKTITWTLGEQEAGAFGTVSFVVKVLDLSLIHIFYGKFTAYGN